MSDISRADVARDFLRAVAVAKSLEVHGDFTDVVIPKGTRGTVVECYEQPEEHYAVDVAIPDDSLAGGVRYENVVLKPEQFAVHGLSLSEN